MKTLILTITPTDQALTIFGFIVGICIIAAGVLIANRIRTENKNKVKYNDWLTSFMDEAKKHDWSLKKTDYQTLRAYWENDFSPKEAIQDLLIEEKRIGVKP